MIMLEEYSYLSEVKIVLFDINEICNEALIR